ncbi:MAG: phospholipid/cholesterol/gamma-HCH transport system permease protein, partial [Sulfurimonas sp.]
MIFSGEFNLFKVGLYEKKIDKIDLSSVQTVDFDLEDVVYFDTAASIFINTLIKKLQQKDITSNILTHSKDILDTLDLIKELKKISEPLPKRKQKTLLAYIGAKIYKYIYGFLLFMEFIGKLFATKLSYLKSFKNIRVKEIAFEINASAIKAIGIIALTSFLIGLVIAYQSAFQLKIYGANIFIVDMLGISILRELAPLMTAVVIAGRSGSAFTAQIGAMKITQELDAMRTLGFDPYLFLVMPRII